VSAAGHTILVTGATDGLGRAVAGQFAAQGATLLIHGPDDERARQTIAEIRAAVPGAELHSYFADLASLAEVSDLADRIAAAHVRIDAVLSNAGIGTTTPGDGTRMESADGHELCAPFLAPAAG
jgi:NAD(P)-dependent dehydrogenase (short-subunit alcohol dehydrogenase family)